MTSPSLRLAFVAASLSLAAAACGTAASAHLAGGTTGSGGSGGASSTSTTTTSSSTGVACGGKAGLPCGPTEFCHFDPSSPCGNFDAEGTCEPRPTGCLDDCPGVCGCDGAFYCNACMANAAGIDVGPSAKCMGADTYEAVSLFTNEPRFAILKASPQRNLCFRLIVVTGAGSGLSGFTGNVSVESGIVTHDAADCEVPGAPLPTPSSPYPVVSGMGTVDMTGPPGCAASVHAKLVFSGAPSWAPASEAMDADGLTIAGGCP